jgi:hypothetical protein
MIARNAGYVLEIFRTRNVAIGEFLMSGDVALSFFARASGDNFQAAINYAEEQGWIEDEGTHIRLLAQGYREMQRVSPTKPSGVDAENQLSDRASAPIFE